MNESKIQIRHVDKVFKSKGREVQALQDVSLNIRGNEFITFVGASGCGKSTLLRSIGGLEQHSAGSIQVIPACGPYHLYELVEYTSQPIAPMSTGACGVRCTPSITTLAPAAWAAAVMAVMSGIVPIAFDIWVSDTTLVRGEISFSNSSMRKLPSSSMGAHLITAPWRSRQ